MSNCCNDRILRVPNDFNPNNLTPEQCQVIFECLLTNGTPEQFDAFCAAMGLTLTVSTGPDGVIANATASDILDLCANETIHFFSPDDSILFTVTEGSVVGAQLNPTVLAGIQHTAITGIDLQPTGNPNEFTVEITWTDGDGNSQTTTDPTPITVSDTSSSVEVATAPLTTTNGVNVEAGETYILMPNGDTWAFVNVTVTGEHVDNTDPLNPIVKTWIKEECYTTGAQANSLLEPDNVSAAGFNNTDFNFTAPIDGTISSIFLKVTNATGSIITGQSFSVSGPPANVTLDVPVGTNVIEIPLAPALTVTAGQTVNCNPLTNNNVQFHDAVNGSDFQHGIAGTQNGAIQGAFDETYAGGVTVRTYDDGSLYQVDKDGNTVSEIASIPATWTLTDCLSDQEELRIQELIGELDTFGTVITATSAITTSNGINVPVGGFYVELPDGTTYAHDGHTVAVGCAAGSSLGTGIGSVPGTQPNTFVLENGVTLNIGAGSTSNGIDAFGLLYQTGTTQLQTITFPVEVTNVVVTLNDLDGPGEYVQVFQADGVAVTPTVGTGAVGPNGNNRYWTSGNNGSGQFIIPGPLTELTFQMNTSGGGVRFVSVEADGIIREAYVFQYPDGTEEVRFRDDDSPAPDQTLLDCPIDVAQLPPEALVDTFGTVTTPNIGSVTTTNGVTVNPGEFYLAFPDGTTWAAPSTTVAASIDFINRNSSALGNEPTVVEAPNPTVGSKVVLLLPDDGTGNENTEYWEYNGTSWTLIGDTTDTNNAAQVYVRTNANTGIGPLGEHTKTIYQLDPGVATVTVSADNASTQGGESVTILARNNTGGDVNVSAGATTYSGPSTIPADCALEITYDNAGTSSYGYLLCQSSGTESGDASNVNGSPQDLSANLLSLLPDRVAWHFHVRNGTSTFTAGGATMNVTVDGVDVAAGVTSHVVPIGAQGYAIRVGATYQVMYQTLPGSDPASTELGNLIIEGDDGEEYAFPLKETICYLEPSTNFTESLDSPGVAGVGTFTSNVSAINAAGGFTLPGLQDMIDQLPDGAVYRVPVIRILMNSNNQGNQSLINSTQGVASGQVSSNLVNPNTVEAFTFPSSHVPLATDVFTFGGIVNANRQVAVDPNGTIAEIADGSAFISVRIEMEYSLPIEHRVSTYSDGETDKLIEFDAAGDPQELATIPATWVETDCLDDSDEARVQELIDQAVKAIKSIDRYQAQSFVVAYDERNATTTGTFDLSTLETQFEFYAGPVPVPFEGVLVTLTNTSALPIDITATLEDLDTFNNLDSVTVTIQPGTAEYFFPMPGQMLGNNNAEGYDILWSGTNNNLVTMDLASPANTADGEFFTQQGNFKPKAAWVSGFTNQEVSLVTYCDDSTSACIDGVNQENPDISSWTPVTNTTTSTPDVAYIGSFTNLDINQVVSVNTEGVSQNTSQHMGASIVDAAAYTLNGTTTGITVTQAGRYEVTVMLRATPLDNPMSLTGFASASNQGSITNTNSQALQVGEEGRWNQTVIVDLVAGDVVNLSLGGASVTNTARITNYSLLIKKIG